MKKKHLFLVVAALFLIFTVSVLLSAMPTGKDSTSLANVSIPDDLNLVFKNSCMDCHATGGNRIAMTKLNFSVWDNYKQEVQAKEAAAICKEVSDRSMPPKSYSKSNPDLVPTESQKDSICKWSGTLTPNN